MELKVMSYRPIIIPGTKQQRITIPKELGLEPGKEVVILYLEDYNKLTPGNAEDLTKKILDLEETNKEILEKLELAEKTINRLTEDIEEKNIKLAAYDKDKAKLTRLETRLKDVTELYVTSIEKLAATNENATRDILDKINDEYSSSIKNIGFIDRLLNRISIDIDLSKYKDDLKEAYGKQLKDSKDKLYLTEKIEEDDVIDVE